MNHEKPRGYGFFKNIVLGKSGDFPKLIHDENISSTQASNDWYNGANDYIALNARNIMWGTMEGVASGIGVGTYSKCPTIVFCAALAIDGIRRVSKGGRRLDAFTSDMKKNGLRITMEP